MPNRTRKPRRNSSKQREGDTKRKMNENELNKASIIPGRRENDPLITEDRENGY